MAGQDTLIYIDENDQLDAGISANKFTKEDIRNRAYYNTLGAKLVKKFLASENVNVSNIYNIHNIHKILEELDISDIMLNNIHIDVRVVFNENYIFVPKSHFEYDILPDIYLVLLMSNDKKYMKFLGFFEPKLINKNNQNEEYYFIEKEKLSAPENLKEYINNCQSNTAQKLSEAETDNADFMILSLIDHDISEKDKKQLLKNLVKSAELRDRFIEFENFELLSYKAEHSSEIIKPSQFMENSINKAEAGAEAALQELTFTQATNANAKDEEIMNGFNDLERNIPDLTPLEDESHKTFTAFERNLNNTIIEELPTDNTTSEILDTSIIDESEVTSSSSLSQDEIIENLEPTLDIADMSDAITQNLKESDFAEQNINEDLTIDIDELPTIDMASAANSSLELDTETVNLEDIEEVPHQNKEITAPQAETVDLDSIDTVPQDKHIEENSNQEILNFDDIEEVVTENKEIQTTPIETIDMDSIEPVSDESHSSNDTLAQETVDLDSIETVDANNVTNKNQQSESDIIPQSFDEIENETSINLEDIDMSELSNSLSLEESTEDNITFEDISSIDDLAEAETPIEELNETNNTTSSTVEDKELDEMLALENLTDDNSNMANDLSNSEASISPINTNDDSTEELLNDNTSEIDENNEVNTGDLISEIDDLLESEDAPIEENMPQDKDENNEDNDTKLEMLFNNTNEDNEEAEDELYENDHYIDQQKVSAPEKGKKGIIVAAALVAVLAAAAGTGFFLKSKNASDTLAQNPIENDTASIPSADAEPADNIVDNTDLMTNAPSSAPSTATPAPAAPVQKDNTSKPTTPAAQKTTEAKPGKTQVQKPQQKPSGTPTPYVTVRSLTWEVPDYLSYSDKVKRYLQTAGKSIRLTLSSDLLLATEYAYSNQVRVEIKLNKDGSIIDAQITKSSGSNQINDIVLRTVKDTLNVVKPAPGEIPTNTYKLGLIINF